MVFAETVTFVIWPPFYLYVVTGKKIAKWQTIVNFKHSLPGLIVLYLAKPFFTLKVFLHEMLLLLLSLYKLHIYNLLVCIEEFR